MNRFKTIMLLCCLLAPVALQAQQADSASNWTRKGIFSLTTNNSGYSNWVQGGVDAFALNVSVDYLTERKGEYSTWTNIFAVAYGLTRISGQDFPTRKTQDKLEIGSKYSYRLNDSWDYSASLLFQSQFTEGYSYTETNDRSRRSLISDFFAPAYLTAAAGFTLKEKNLLRVGFSPLSMRMTFVANEALSDAGAFGVDKGDRMRTQGGANIDARLDWEFMKNSRLKSRLILFSDYEKFQNVDINWEAILFFKINKLLFAQIDTQMIYDDEIDVVRSDNTTGPDLQLKYVLSFGLSWEF
ncbi:MAG: DUF3078 domain-containing protein [Cytophagales bacterium]|nr:DUF3078 domain-containing protein [Cytophagales bacterium]